jgi:hypothetical protein
MAGVWTDEALKWYLKTPLYGPVINTYYLRLFTNNYTPDGGSVSGDFTECSTSGYSAQPVGSDGNWSYSVTTPGALAETGPYLLTFAAAVTLYGWYITCSGGTGGVVAAERFGSPIVIPAGGGSLNLTVDLTLNHCP